MSKELDCFLGLCYRAQEILIDFIKEDCDYLFFNAFSFSNFGEGLSPIEQIFYAQYMINYALTNPQYMDFEVQEHIRVGKKEYIADFVVYSRTDRIKGRFKLKHLKRPLIIELDGKEFHSSKEQMNYDYERENALKLAGYDVIRFTGSQVYNNPQKCIDDTFEYVYKAEAK
ncbi:MAG: DUF559 domain-containing protein [Clostridia bacterium]|nr:DUF559 domain-containing protein [Clostridia bacterium]